jgi:hypothetical protein
VVDWFKKALDGPDFLQLDVPSKVLSSALAYPVIMAHNRFATKGGVSTDTAHPFTHGDITLCHNGTLDTQYGLPEHTKFAVDSENIAYAFAVDGAKETIPKLQGAFALTWFDEAEDTFNMVRNDERPLCLAINKLRNVTYYASERKMLEAILHRNKVTDVDYLEVKPGKLVSWKLDGAKVEAPRIKNVKLYEKPPYVAPAYQGGGYQQRLTHVQSSAEILSDWKLLAGDRVEFYTTGVTPYSANQVIGNMEGMMCEDPYVEVKAFSVSTSLIAGYYEGVVQSGAKRGREEYIVVRELLLKEVIENDANNLGREDEVEEALTGKK